MDFYQSTLFNKEIYEIIPGFITSLLLTLVVSLFTKVPVEIDEEFEKVTKIVKEK